MSDATSAVDLKSVQVSFCEVLPGIEGRARRVFRHLRCQADREDKVAEVVGMAWQSYRKLAEQGKDADRMVPNMAKWAIAKVAQGRKLIGKMKGKRFAQGDAHQAQLGQLGSVEIPEESSTVAPLDMWMNDFWVASPALMAEFRIDFKRWLNGLDTRQRRIVRNLADGYQAKAVAVQEAVSESRIGQIREQLRRSWGRFQGIQ